jgi:hypothetical protein
MGGGLDKELWKYAFLSEKSLLASVHLLSFMQNDQN